MTTERLNIIIAYARLIVGLLVTLAVLYMYLTGRVQLQEMLGALGVLLGIDRAADGAQTIIAARRKKVDKSYPYE